jgi:glucose-1-phosphate thymidylyltransferase
MNKAVILARGLGKRMREEDTSAQVIGEQARLADAGMKAMIPAGGRPFLDYVLSALADSGIRRVCLVVGPEHAAIQEYYKKLSSRSIEIQFAIQRNANGTARALLAARPFIGEEPFLALNSDNYYPTEVFAGLRALGEPGLAAFERESLIEKGNIPRERVRDFALLGIDEDGYLERIVEKPDEAANAAMAANGGETFVSMNCWRFDPAIFRACEKVPMSARGEFELPEAVQFGISVLGLRFKSVPFHAGVFDLSRRSDIAEVEKRLSGIKVNL